MGVLSGLYPEKVFQFFEEICSIPHGSSDTWHISNYLVDFAKKRNLKVHQDKLGNVIIWKNGTKDGDFSYENSPSVLIQGHMDMVCEKDKDSDIDFSKDGLKLRVNGNVIDADGTTLGGDDGIAVAYALAILDAGDDIPHPPLEVVITVDEEIGMLGAADIDGSLLKSRIMLNLDSEDEGQLLVSCAGGVTSRCILPIETHELFVGTASGFDEETGEPVVIDFGTKIYELSVVDATGGHSGMEIIKQSANASKVLGRILYEIMEQDLPVYLQDISGGKKDNAIPREAFCRFVIGGKPVETEKNIIVDNVDSYKRVVEIVDNFTKILQAEYHYTDPEMKLGFREVSMEELCIKKLSENDKFEKDSIPREIPISTFSCLTKDSTKRVISLLHAVPNGVKKMSASIGDLVQTSLNLGIMKMDRETKTFSLGFSVRSSVNTEKNELTSILKCITNAIGGTYEESGDYPAWEYKEDSQLRDLMVDIYKKQYGEKPEVVAIHAGVECGLFAGKLDGLDCVSYGPQMDDIHTSRERLYIDSVQRTWDYTLEILKNLK